MHSIVQPGRRFAMKTEPSCPVATFPSRIGLYKFDSNDGIVFFDWLVMTAIWKGYTEFTYPIQKILKTTKVSRRQQEKYTQQFIDLGFLKVFTRSNNMGRYRSYFVDFSILKTPEVLSHIIEDKDSSFKRWATYHATCQKKATKASAIELANNNDFINATRQRLEGTYNERIRMYNEGKLTGQKPNRLKKSTELSNTKAVKDKIGRLLVQHSDQAIIHAFLVYADDILRGSIKPSRILQYFLAEEDGEFKLFDSYLNKFNMDYSYERV